MHGTARGCAGVARWIGNVGPLWWALAVAVCAGAPAGAVQVELPALPAAVELDVGSATRLELGVHAEDPVQNLTVGGRLLAGGLLHEGTVMVLGDGSGIYAYHDLFLRNYRGRSQQLTALDGESWENLNDLPAGAALPKVMLDADRIAATDLFLSGQSDVLGWTGEIVWRFDLGLPVLGVALSDPTGRRETLVEDGEWQENGHVVVVSLSADGATWYEVWRSHDEGGISTVTAELPPELEGSTTLYLRFQGTENVLRALYFSAQVDASEVLPALDLHAGRMALDLGASAGGPVIVFWSDEAVIPVQDQPAPPAVPEVHGVGDRIRVSFPGGEVAEFCRDTGGAVTGICKVAAGGLPLLDRAPGDGGHARLMVLDGDPIPPYTDWAAERHSWEANGFTWPSTGTRTLRPLDLAGAHFVGPEVWADGTVALRQTLSDGDESGELIWLLRTEELSLGGRRWKGLSWRVILIGLERAMSLELDEPMALEFGQWWIEQVFRGVTDHLVDFTRPYDLPETRLFGFSQSFRFTAGAEGATLGLFQEPVAADVTVREERGRCLARLRIPLGAGTIRATPWRSWLMAPEPAADRWAANDLWSEVRRSYAGMLAGRVGFEPILPKPTLVWVQPSDAYFETWRATGQPPGGVYWLDDVREHTLPAAQAAGLQTLYIQAPWDSDAEHTDGGFSGQAIRVFDVGAAIGGPDRMRAMIDRAHELGLEIVLWFPSTFSPYSNLLETHPDWAVYTASGRPDDGGWGDIVVVNLHTAYLPWMIGKLRALQGRLGFDGLWLDSWSGITLDTDYTAIQPFPQLDGAVELVRAMWALELSQVITEGLTPFAQGDAYGDYESPSGPPWTNDDVRLSVARILGREYLLYGIKAGAPLTDVDMYRRALAAGGLIAVANLDEVDLLPDDDRQDLVTANRVAMELQPWRQHRELIGRDEDWLGVRWWRDGRAGWVVFAFEAFDEAVSPGMAVRDMVSGEDVAVENGVFTTTAWHTYRVTPAAPARRRGGAAAASSGAGLTGPGPAPRDG